MPDNVYKSGEISDDGSGITIKDLGPEEKFAKNVLTSLKDKISEARQELKEIEEEMERKKKQAEETRDEIIEEAEQEADQIRQEAEQEAEELLQTKQEEVESAREEGYDEGFEEGRQDAQEEMAEYVDQSAEILDEAKRKREAYLGENTEALIGLAGELAAHIVRDSVNVDSDTAERVVRSALDEIEDVRTITVILSPDDAQAVRDVKDELTKEHPHLEKITVKADDKMERGGCKIRTDFGDVEGTIEGQVEHLTETLIERHRSDGDESTLTDDD